MQNHKQEVILDFSTVYPRGLDEKGRKAWEEEMGESAGTSKVGKKRRFGPRGRKMRGK